MRLPKTVALASVLALGACGASITSPSVPAAGSGAGVAVPFSAFQTDLNNARSGPGLNPLVYNAKLTAAAQVHADDMSTNGFFSHTGSDGSTLGTRLAAQGYNYAWAGENIAQGYASQSAVFTAWMNSAPHRANMLSAEPTQYGLAWAPGDYWVLDLARPFP